ncbi:MAG: endonuclease/exonuclease/phosphatase family protein [Chloroflexi bacterium]|nr:endonuclease/exonuclease/phosphatase family protein [Chloroflexota bacterium]
MTLTLVNWNVEWATHRAPRGREIQRRIHAHAPDIVCLTEAGIGLLDRPGHAIHSQPDSGYGVRQDRRKVILWSRQPWESVDCEGTESLPPGRFVSGVTRTPVGEARVVGVCIPWFGSRTEKKRGPEQKRQWEDHAQYLAGLSEVLARDSATRLIVLGDFNQVIGTGSRAPAELRSALRDAFPPGMSIATADLTFRGHGSIDHVAVSEHLAVESVAAISNPRDGKPLSDHFGVAAEISASRSRQPRSDPTG